MFYDREQIPKDIPGGEDEDVDEGDEDYEPHPWRP